MHQQAGVVRRPIFSKAECVSCSGWRHRHQHGVEPQVRYPGYSRSCQHSCSRIGKDDGAFGIARCPREFRTHTLPVLQGSCEESRHIKQKVEDFLNNELKLQVAEDKTRIRIAKQGIQFLSYDISTWRTDKKFKKKVKGTYTSQRTVTETIMLKVPSERVRKFCKGNDYAAEDLRVRPRHRRESLTARVSGWSSTIR